VSHHRAENVATTQKRRAKHADAGIGNNQPTIQKHVNWLG